MDVLLALLAVLHEFLIELVAIHLMENLAMSWEKLTPFPRSWLTINESLVCALHSELASHKVAINK